MGEGGQQLLTTTTLESDTSGNMQILIGSSAAIPRGIISVDKKWRLKVGSNFRFDWRLFDGDTEGRTRRQGRGGLNGD